MTISIWRYCHFILAVSSFLFLALAAITGVILAYDAINEQALSYRIADLDKIRLSETLPILHKKYAEITEISVDKNQSVILQGIDQNDQEVYAYIDPRTGKILGSPAKKTEFIQWTTALHRSLFLHELGRFFVGLTCFLLLLITISGMALLIQRQNGFRHFFNKVIKDNFAQYWHVLLGRLSLLPILIIAITGTYLSLVRFGIFPEKEIKHRIDFQQVPKAAERKALADFPIFKEIRLSDLKTIAYPFSDDPEEYYTLKLTDREIIVDQHSAEVLTEVSYPFTTFLTNLSLDLHTGQTSIIWAIVLALASINILFFIYSGFAITLKRRSGLVKNKYTADESEYLLLVGSENGSTLRFASALQQQLLSAGQSSHLTEMNNYRVFPKAKHILIFSATHGLGNAPSNASKFMSLIDQHTQTGFVQVAVVGFGSKKYADFCAFAFEVCRKLSTQPWAVPLLETFTVDGQSTEQFSDWANVWSKKVNLPLVISPALLQAKPSGLQSMVLVEKSELANMDHIFRLSLRPRSRSRFSSGDLLAIYPDGDEKERLYSIGKIGQDIQLIVKLHPEGLGSSYLHELELGKAVKVRLVKNSAFHFPAKAPLVAMLANGTGIAPFLGMIAQNNKNVETHLYAGFRTQASLPETVRTALQHALQKGNLQGLNITTSKEGEKQRITQLIAEDEVFFAKLLQSGGVIMICGSVAMQNDVLQLLSKISLERTGLKLSDYSSKGQILTDCY